MARAAAVVMDVFSITNAHLGCGSLTRKNHQANLIPTATATNHHEQKPLQAIFCAHIVVCARQQFRASL
jgi:hypothetical protein